MSQDTISSKDLPHKEIEAGSGISIKIIDDKILISADNTTKIRHERFLIEGEEVKIEAGRGIKISTRHPNILLIEANTTKQDEAIYDLKDQMDERLKTIEVVFAKILKSVKT